MVITMEPRRYDTTLVFEQVHKKILPFVTQVQPDLNGLQNILLDSWHLMQNQRNLRDIFKECPLISYRKGLTCSNVYRQTCEGY